MKVNQVDITLSGCLEPHNLTVEYSSGVALITVDKKNVAQLYKKDLGNLIDALQIFYRGMP